MNNKRYARLGRAGSIFIIALLTVACGSGASSGPVPSAASCGTAVGNPAAKPPEAYSPGSQVQPQLAANPVAQTQLYGVWEQDRWNAIGARTIEFFSSADGGASWSASAALPVSACGATSGVGAAYDRASDPSIAVASGSVIVASALAFSAGGYLAAGGTSAVLVTRSTDGGATWQAPAALIADTGTGVGPYHFNDRDALAADPAGGYVYLVWDRLTSDTSTESIPTWMASSTDGGLTWGSSRIIFDPGVLNQTFNNQPLVLPDGSVVDIFSLVNGFGAQLTFVRSTDHGVTWPVPPGTPIATMTPVGASDPVPGGPPIRDSSYMGQTAVDPVAGTLAVVWQEGSFSGGLRDGIALSLSTDKGATWSAPVQVNTDSAVAAFNPTVHFGPGGRIAVTYYDFRDYASGSTVLSTDLWQRQSSDGGASWTETRLYGPFDLNKAPPADQVAGSTGSALFLGDQQGLAWNGSSWVALFSATNSLGARIFSATLP